MWVWSPKVLVVLHLLSPLDGYIPPVCLMCGPHGVGLRIILPVGSALCVEADPVQAGILHSLCGVWRAFCAHGLVCVCIGGSMCRHPK